MREFDCLIRGGTVANAADTFSCDIGIRNGHIAALGQDLGEAREVIDAAGKLVLPGGIDSHVHLAQPSGPGIVMADDFESGTRSAAFGGNTTVLPFACRRRARPCARRSSRTSEGGRAVSCRCLVSPNHRRPH